MRLSSTLFACAVSFTLAAVAAADEGLWLFNQPPRGVLKEKYQFEPSDAWLAHLQRSSVRFNSGGSGSFVSSDGLVMTNHHVSADCIQKLSAKDRDYLRGGFHAKTRAEELKCHDLELNVLMSIEDVTDRVNAAVKPGMTSAEAFKARRAVMNTIEKESHEKTGLRSDVVTLYHGGRYHLYRYKKYTDVRLVFAPEQDIAFFGGDPDNFEYPRYDLDICFVRVYEDGKPAKVEHFLKWSEAGAADGELIFVAGHPGHTDRLDTVAHLEFLRDRVFPQSLSVLYRWEVLLSTFSERSRENARRARDDLFGVQNSRKARLGGLSGLQDPAVMDQKRREEAALRSALKPEDQAPWSNVSEAMKSWGEIYQRHYLLERGVAFNSELFRIARMLVRMADETTKPNADRLHEYAESGLESLRLALFSEAPIYSDLETLKLADSLAMYLEMAGPHDELVRQALAGKSPNERAAQLVGGTQLADVAVRKKLAEGGAQAIAASTDPMIQLARLVDEPARKVRRTYEDRVEEPLRQAYAKIALKQFEVRGSNVYPDATFTLRLSFGAVQGYTAMGKPQPPWTTLAGAFQRAKEQDNREPFRLPDSWTARKQKLDLGTPFNFVATADIIGGNSGSPVVNRAGEVVGIIFDGNLESLVWDFVYTEKLGRAIAVHSQAIREALRKVYDAAALADELGK